MAAEYKWLGKKVFILSYLGSERGVFWSIPLYGEVEETNQKLSSPAHPSSKQKN